MIRKKFPIMNSYNKPTVMRKLYPNRREPKNRALSKFDLEYVEYVEIGDDEDDDEEYDDEE